MPMGWTLSGHASRKNSSIKVLKVASSTSGHIAKLSRLYERKLNCSLCVGSQVIVYESFRRAMIYLEYYKMNQWRSSPADCSGFIVSKDA